MMSEDFIFKKSVLVRDRFCILPRMKKSMRGIVPYQKFFMSCTLLQKENFNMWVASGSYVGQICCGSVGQMGQQV